MPETSWDEIVYGMADLIPASGESYEDFVARAARDPVGKAVKLANLMENSDLPRIAEPSQKDLERVEKYGRAIRYLMAN